MYQNIIFNIKKTIKNFIIIIIETTKSKHHMEKQSPLYQPLKKFSPLYKEKKTYKEIKKMVAGLEPARHKDTKLATSRVYHSTIPSTFL